MFEQLKKDLYSVLATTVEVTEAVGKQLIGETVAPVCKITGSHLFKQGNFQQAEKYYDQIINAEPHNANAWYNKGSCLINQRKYKEASYYIEKTLAIKPDHALAKKAKDIILLAIRAGKFK